MGINRISTKEQSLVERAYEEDSTRYFEMSPDVFNATVPFGAIRRWLKDLKTTKRNLAVTTSTSQAAKLTHHKVVRSAHHNFILYNMGYALLCCENHRGRLIYQDQEVS